MLRKILFTTIAIIALATAVASFQTSSARKSQLRELVAGESSLSKVLSTFTTTKSTTADTITNVDIIENTNKERVLAGLQPLSTDTLLNASAELKVDDMIARQYFEHESPSGKGVSDLGDDVGYQYVIMGENLALGTFASAQEIVQAWMDSPGHRANILGTKYQQIGVSAKQGLFEGKKVWFAVQHFGTSRGVCPTISASLKREITSINADLKQREQAIETLKQRLEAPGASTSPTYQSDVQAFNALVGNYNAALSISKEKITTYNLQVRSFNTCIGTFQ